MKKAGIIAIILFLWGVLIFFCAKSHAAEPPFWDNHWIPECAHACCYDWSTLKICPRFCYGTDYQAYVFDPRAPQWAPNDRKCTEEEKPQ